jgi:hypothetical protein
LCGREAEEEDGGVCEYDAGGEGVAGQDFQTSINPAQEGGETGQEGVKKPTKLSKLQHVSLAIFEIGKRSWVGNVDEILALPEVLDKYTNHIVCHEREIRTILQSAVDCWARQMSVRYLSWDKAQAMLNEAPATFGVAKFMSRQDSFEIMIWWIRHNFVDARKRVLKLKPWFDRENGKKNTLLMVGPPSCGKTLFADALLRIGLFRGGILNYSKGAQFSFMDCINCRLIAHDECEWPIACPEYTESLKKIWGGGIDSVNVKFKGKQLSAGCPVIATANNPPVKDARMYDAVYKRVWRWDFNHKSDMDSLKDNPNVPAVYGPYHPMAVFDLYNYFNDGVYMMDE